MSSLSATGDVIAVHQGRTENGLAGSTLEFVSDEPKPAAAQMASDLASGTMVYIAHVPGPGGNSTHHVLLIQAADQSGTAFTANDPGAGVNTQPATYLYGAISDVIAYRVVPHTEPRAFEGFDQCNPEWGPTVMGAWWCCVLRVVRAVCCVLRAACSACWCCVLRVACNAVLWRGTFCRQRRASSSVCIDTDAHLIALGSLLVIRFPP